MKYEFYPEGKLIVKFGEIGDKMYLIIKGCVNVSVPTNFRQSTLINIGNKKQIDKFQEYNSQMITEEDDESDLHTSQGSRERMSSQSKEKLSTFKGSKKEIEQVKTSKENVKSSGKESI